MIEEGIRKSAILLMSLDEESAASVIQHMAQEEVQQLALAMGRLNKVTRAQVVGVMEEFREETEQYSAININSSEYIHSVLNKALGSDRAAGIIEEILDSHGSASGFDKLNQLEAMEVAELIRNEHPQIIATLLVHLDRSKASTVLELLDERLRHDVILRVSTFGGVQPAALSELTDVLFNLLSGGVKRSRLGGVRAAAEIINLMSSAEEENVIRHVREYDPDLAQRITDEMFLFEDLLEIEDQSIQLLLKEIESETLIIALKGAPQELRDKFLKNMSQRAAEMLREDIDIRGPVRVSQVEAEQKNILQVLRRLADAGQVTLGAQGKDAYV